MRSKIDAQSEEAEKAVRDIRRATRRHFSAEDKVRIVIAGQEHRRIFVSSAMARSSSASSRASCSSRFHKHIIHCP